MLFSNRPVTPGITHPSLVIIFIDRSWQVRLSWSFVAFGTQDEAATKYLEQHF
jgi:hypothetical protein